MFRLAILTFAALLAFCGTAFADDAVPPPQPTLSLPSIQFWSLVIGSLVPLATYLINHYGPQTDERVKGLIQVVVAAVAGALYQLLNTGDLALNTATLQVVGTAVAAALFAHRLLWLPSGISTALGGGTNKSGQRAPFKKNVR